MSFGWMGTRGGFGGMGAGGAPTASTSPPIDGLPMIAFDGGGVPSIPPVNAPAAFYDSVQGKTWAVYGSSPDGVAPTVSVVVANHADQSLVNVNLGAITFGADAHNPFATVMDGSGYVHVMGGTHNTVFQYFSTTSPRDPTTFTSRTMTFSGTYANLAVVGSNLYFFYRDTTTQQDFLVIGALSAGVATWGTPFKFMDFQGSTRGYRSNVIARGTDIHFTSTYADSTDTWRNNQYYLIYNTLDGSIRNIDGSLTVAAASFPVTKTQLDASFKFYTSADTSHATSTAALEFDAAGVPHVVFSDGLTAGTSFTNVHMYYSGGSWHTDTLGVSDNQYTGGAVSRAADGGVDLYWIQNSANAAFTRGGDVWKAHVPPSLAIGSSSLFYTAVDQPIEDIGAVLNSSSDARIFFTETLQVDMTVIGTLLCFLWGEKRGYIKTPWDTPVTVNRGLAGYWPMEAADFNFTANTLQDRSGNGSTGALTGLDATKLVAGQVGGAIRTNINQSIVFGTPAILRPASLPITVSAWVNPNAYDGNYSVIYATDIHANTGGIFILMTDAGKIYCGIGDGAGNGSTHNLNKTGTRVMPLGAWTHITVVFPSNAVASANNIMIFQNGIIDIGSAISGSVSAFGYVAGNAGRAGIDTYQGADTFNGNIDELTQNNAALAPWEVMKRYQAGLIAHR